MRKDVLFFTTLLISFSASATTIDFYSDASCQTSQNTVTVTEDLRNGTCYELSNTNSVNPVSVDASCAGIYSALNLGRLTETRLTIRLL